VDAHIGQVAELRTMKGRLDARTDEVEHLRDRVRAWQAEWRGARIAARQLGAHPAARLLSEV
jgi:hypothetical protein